ncbi:hypothetical protein PLESTB_000225000 [Pleodorina starrii]|uniref:Uncharacterized protein n=1 Tax=Pleodorina starrii TaxID=330485 RepID=A0A9W6BD77_9CHLO|nr:hypothetical protein PLESTM_002055000 [Pleodorina starrii]GLC49492.1 hypothetical protein PLESTB_000225000 [Pleodorina starrii]GLC70407.1 hypothetical protein PLESTF_000970100 [Pleodorina starrii]
MMAFRAVVVGVPESVTMMRSHGVFPPHAGVTKGDHPVVRSGKHVPPSKGFLARLWWGGSKEVSKAEPGVSCGCYHGPRMTSTSRHLLADRIAVLDSSEVLLGGASLFAHPAADWARLLASAARCASEPPAQQPAAVALEARAGAEVEADAAARGCHVPAGASGAVLRQVEVEVADAVAVVRLSIAAAAAEGAGEPVEKDKAGQQAAGAAAEAAELWLAALEAAVDAERIKRAKLEQESRAAAAEAWAEAEAMAAERKRRARPIAGPWVF